MGLGFRVFGLLFYVFLGVIGVFFSSAIAMKKERPKNIQVCFSGHLHGTIVNRLDI